MSSVKLGALVTAALISGACASSDASREYDPLEGFNRKTFWFNEQADRFVLKPVSEAWDWLLPTAAERAVRRFFLNLAYPVNLLNNLLQGKLVDGAEETARFVVNTTAGVGGFFDPATTWGLSAHPEDFGQTLGAWGVGPGPYVVLPLFGPSSMRDGLSSIPDHYSLVTPFYVDSLTVTGAYTAYAINSRSLSAEEIENAKAASLDYYVLRRNAYLQRRESLVRDGAAAEAPENEPEDLYSEDLYDDQAFDDEP